MKKGRHRRFEEARALKRGPDEIDIEGLLGEGAASTSELDDHDDEDDDDPYDPYTDEGRWVSPEAD